MLGTSHRITHNGGTTRFAPDAGCRLLFNERRVLANFDGDGQARVRQLFTVARKWGLPQKLPLPYGANGSSVTREKWLAYTCLRRRAH